MSIIEVDHITKEFRLGTLTNFRQTALNAVNRVLGRPVQERKRFKALDDVSFTVEEGEVLGIIGHNGAGKSTLLKLLSGISRPTRGDITVRGRIAPLIEVGAGFVPDFTGRENVYINGAIMGMSRREIAKKFDEIVGFAELQEFIDTPVKRYSSGMQVRLAFAVATSVVADILIADEVLAVGDIAFQRKCFDRMEEMIKRQGRTVLLVSHNIRQVQRICTRTIMMDHGRAIADGETKNVCNLFYEKSDEKIQADAKRTMDSVSGTRGQSSDEVSLLDLRLCTVSGLPCETVEPLADVVVELAFEAHQPLRNPVFAVGFHTPDFLYIATPRSVDGNLPQHIEPGRYRVLSTINRLPLVPGTYALRASISAGVITRTVLYVENRWHFRVSSDTFERSMMKSEALITVPATWELLDNRHSQQFQTNIGETLRIR
jgi:ABC-type polysaccharide/polyol phosphate transport system ATPase subunit